MTPRFRSSCPALCRLLPCVLAAVASGAPRTPVPPEAQDAAQRANNVGVAWLEQYHYDEAVRAFGQALTHDPGLTLARVNLAIALANLPDMAGAERAARAALLEAPASLHAQYVLGLAARSEGRAADAQAAFRRVLAADPGDVGARVNLGQLLMQERRYEDAAAEFRAAAESEPTSGTALYNLSLALNRAGRREEAHEPLRRFEALRESGAAKLIGSNYPEQGRYAEAQQATGVEPGLVDVATPAARFVDASAELPAAARAPSTDGGGGTALFDFDGDGVLDVLDVRTTGLRLLRAAGGRFEDVTVAAGLAAARGGVGALAGDCDADGDLDVVVLRADGLGLFTQAGGRYTDATAVAGVAEPAGAMRFTTAALSDVDHDGDLDLFVAGVGGTAGPAAPSRVLPEPTAAPPRLYRNDGTCVFKESAEAAGLRAAPLPAVAVAPSDYDNGRDVDLLLLGDGAAPRLYHNQRDLTFRDVARDVGLLEARRYSALAAGDFDKDGFVDFFLGVADGPDRLVRRDARGAWRVEDAPEGSSGSAAALFVDYDSDGLLDLLTLGASGLRVLRNAGARFVDVSATALGFDGARSEFGRRHRPDGARSEFGRRDPPDGARSEFGRRHQAGGSRPPNPRARRTSDAASDGTRSEFGRRHPPDGARSEFGRRHQAGGSRPPNPRARRTSDAAPDGTRSEFGRRHQAGGSRPPNPRVRRTSDAALGPGPGALASGDLDGDGAPDVLLRAQDGGLRLLRGTGGPPRASVAARLDGLVSNRSGVGVKVELRAAGLWQKLETSSTTPPVAPAGVLFGLGRRAYADALRVLWPSGILQTELLGAAPAAQRVLAVKELDRKPSSCPFLYAWDGERFAFVTDFLGGGEMGYLLAPGVFNTPDPVEHVRLGAEQLRPRDGRYELRVTNELEEVLFVDRLALVAVAHPEDVAVFPNEGMTVPPKPERLIGVRALRAPLGARDHAGRDVLERLSALDRRFVDTLPLRRVRGYAESHALTLDLGPLGPRPVLLLTGWTDYAFSSDNQAAAQAGLELHPPALQVRDERGAWQTVLEQIGIPVGRPQTVAVELSGLWRGPSRELRVVTSMRVYWDQALVGEAVDTTFEAVHLALTRADLSARGFSAPVSPDGREPFGYDYERVSRASPWKVVPGRYTRLGDVRALLSSSDDAFVIARPGDELALTFDAPPEVTPGLARTFLLVADGYSKEMDVNSAAPHAIEPLPFHGMSRYPYGPEERFPWTPARRSLMEATRTRVVTRPLPALEAHVPSAAAAPEGGSR